MNCTLGNFIDDDLKLRLENPTKYYLNHIHDEQVMIELILEDPYLFQRVRRLHFINQFRNHDNVYQCPECRGSIIKDESGEEYCETCGLVTRTHIAYVAGQRISLPFGLK